MIQFFKITIRPYTQPELFSLGLRSMKMDLNNFPRQHTRQTKTDFKLPSPAHSPDQDGLKNFPRQHTRQIKMDLNNFPRQHTRQTKISSKHCGRFSRAG
jgi:hypothetical protein